ncbi:hypothetical protein C8J57DRAFT_1250487 [Mycena rebaudengoi]|nr:hypothetical protein C8J57DRAFT_1250487 [Mycena rebaudengoi]
MPTARSGKFADAALADTDPLGVNINANVTFDEVVGRTTRFFFPFSQDHFSSLFKHPSLLCSQSWEWPSKPKSTLARRFKPRKGRREEEGRMQARMGGTTPERLFFKVNDAHICIMSLEYGVQEDDCCLYVPHHFLQTYAVPHKGAPVLVPWEDWGPHHTTGAACPLFYFPYLKYVHSERAITPRISSDFVSIVDFGVSTCAGYYPDPKEPPHLVVKMCLGPSTMDKPELFTCPVTTCLPYRSTARSMDSTDDAGHSHLSSSLSLGRSPLLFRRSLYHPDMDNVKPKGASLQRNKTGAPEEDYISVHIRRTVMHYYFENSIIERFSEPKVKSSPGVISVWCLYLEGK